MYVIVINRIVQQWFKPDNVMPCIMLDKRDPAASGEGFPLRAPTLHQELIEI